MLQNLIVTLGAGLAGMLLFVLSAKGSVAAVIVTYFTPLPIMIAALGWNQAVGLAAALLGAVLTAIVFHPVLGAIYAGAFALPAWALSYLALLARFDRAPAASVPDGADAVQREWYPVGRLVVWAAAMVATVVIVGVLSVSFSDAGFEIEARSAASQVVPLVEAMLGGFDRLPHGVSAEDLATLAIRTLPIAAGASLTLLHLVNLWLAGRTVEMSRRLTRPWPSLPENLRLPRPAAAVFALAAVVAVLLHAYASLFAAIVAAALGVLFLMQGLSVLHAVTRRRRARGTILAIAYGGLVLLMPWPLILYTILGFVDCIYPLRDRYAAAASIPPRHP